MKKILCFMSVLILIFCTACSGSAVLEETSVPADNIDELSARIGIEMSLPDGAGNVQYSIINDLIAQVQFTYNGIVFTHRSSKAYSGPALYGIEKQYTIIETITVGEDVEAVLTSFKDGATLVEWYENGNHHSLYSAKVIGTDVLTEIIEKL